MSLVFQHFLAWLRGDFDSIVGGFDKLYAKLDAHVAYKATVAKSATAAATTAQAQANTATADATKAAIVRDNIGKLLGK